MKIVRTIWLDHIVDKLAWKHGLSTDEVEQAITTCKRWHRVARGDVPDEDLFVGVGKNRGGRYLLVVFIYKQDRSALIISARRASNRERRRYAK